MDHKNNENKRNDVFSFSFLFDFSFLIFFIFIYFLVTISLTKTPLLQYFNPPMPQSGQDFKAKDDFSVQLGRNKTQLPQDPENGPLLQISEEKQKEIENETLTCNPPSHMYFWDNLNSIYVHA